VNKGGAMLKFDVPLDDVSSIDLRFLKQFIFRTVQCLYSNEKWEKLASLIFRYNVLTKYVFYAHTCSQCISTFRFFVNLKSYAFAEQLSPILIFAQHQLRKQVVQWASNRSSPALSRTSKKDKRTKTQQPNDPLRQPHFELLKDKLARDVTVEDLFVNNFTVVVDPSNIKPLNLGVRLDPRVHDIYNGKYRFWHVFVECVDNYWFCV
jgi:hypothetical protein